MTKTMDEKAAAKLSKDWYFLPYWYKPKHGLIEMLTLFKTPFLTCQVHVINTPDPTGLYHDHPWSFVSFVFRGWYREQIWEDPFNYDKSLSKKRRLFSFHRIKTTQAHRIYECHPRTLTLFICGKWHRDGFRFYSNGDFADISRYVETDGAGKGIIKMKL